MKPRAFSLRRCSEAQRKRLSWQTTRKPFSDTEKGFSWQGLSGDFASTTALASRRYSGFTFGLRLGSLHFCHQFVFVFYRLLTKRGKIKVRSLGLRENLGLLFLDVVFDDLAQDFEFGAIALVFRLHLPEFFDHSLDHVVLFERLIHHIVLVECFPNRRID